MANTWTILAVMAQVHFESQVDQTKIRTYRWMHGFGKQWNMYIEHCYTMAYYQQLSSPSKQHHLPGILYSILTTPISSACSHTAQPQMHRSSPPCSFRERERINGGFSPPIVMEDTKCPSTAMWPCLSRAVLIVLLLPAAMAAAADGHGEEMKSIYAGPKVLPVRLGRPAFGPESLAFDHRGGGPYTGVSNGRILRWCADRRRPGWTEFAHNYKHATVAECAARKKVVAPESVCGRPLGLQFHRRTGDMYIADAYLGLMRVGRRGGLAEVVATEAGGVPLNFVNGATSTSPIAAPRVPAEVLLVVLSGDATGRLLRYEARTGNVTVLKSGLAFPNGVAVSADGTHLVVAETASCRLLRHWLRGSNAGATEVLAELPGYPDNVRPAAADDDDDGGGRGASYWVALNRDKAWTVNGTTPASVAAVRVVVDDGAGAGGGKVAVALRGFGAATVSEVVERNGSLWFGSVDTPYVGLLKLTSL